MEQVLTVVVGFLVGSGTSLVSYYLGSRTYEKAIEFYTTPPESTVKKFESDSTPLPEEQFDWDAYNSYSVDTDQFEDEDDGKIKA